MLSFQVGLVFSSCHFLSGFLRKDR